MADKTRKYKKGKIKIPKRENKVINMESDKIREKEARKKVNGIRLSEDDQREDFAGPNKGEDEKGEEFVSKEFAETKNDANDQQDKSDGFSDVRKCQMPNGQALSCVMLHRESETKKLDLGFPEKKRDKRC